MRFEISWSKQALQDLQNLDSVTVDRITIKLNAYADALDPFAFAKPLHGIYKGLYRFRVGDYRAIFQKNAGGELVILFILRVQHRKDVYE